MRVLSLVVGTCVATLLLSGTWAAAEDQEYIGSSQCKVCHNKKDTGTQWDVWKASMHAKAFETLKSDKAKEVAAKKGITGDPSAAPECLRCHVTAYDAATKAAPAKIKLEDGVQCESCHGPSSLHQADGKIVMFQKDKAASVDIKAHRKTVTEAECIVCHNAENPTWNPEKYTLADGKKAGFDFKQAYEKIKHLDPTKPAK